LLGERGDRGKEEDEKGETEHGIPRNQFTGAGLERSGWGRLRVRRKGAVEEIESE
jgi:hypothetical protein